MVQAHSKSILSCYTYNPFASFTNTYLENYNKVEEHYCRLNVNEKQLFIQKRWKQIKRWMSGETERTVTPCELW